jgi:alcohol dehydrogenase, propanol-preferring
VSPSRTTVTQLGVHNGRRLIRVALPADDKMTIPIFDTVLGGKSVIGSIVGTRKDLADVFALHAAGRTKVIAEERHLADVNECIDEVLAGQPLRAPRGEAAAVQDVGPPRIALTSVSPGRTWSRSGGR